MVDGPAVIQLYRGILRAAKYFPSIKRDRIINEIKRDFHANKGLTDEAKLKKSIAIAVRGLSDLQAYLPKTTAVEGGVSVTLKGMTE